MLTHAQTELARKIFSRPTTFGTVAAGACLQILGEDCLDWEPEILDQELTILLGKDSIHVDVLQRIQAVAVVLGTPAFFRNPQVFHSVCATLLDPDTYPTTMMTPPEPVELAWSCAEVQLLLGEEYSVKNYYPDVSRYCGLALEQSGLYFPPATLRFADFSGHQYPDATKYADEMILMEWTDSQQRQVDQINESVVNLTRLLRDQLLELRAFGGVEEQFDALAKLAEESEASRKPASLPAQA